MEEIKKAIEEEIDRYLYETDGWTTKRCSMEYISNSILSKWQDSERWRKVEEGEYPEVRDNGTSEYVLVKAPYESFHVAQYCKNPFYPNGVWFDPYVELSINVTHWKPIH